MIAIDTGYFFALVDRRDEHHSAAKRWVESAREGWMTTWPVITETCHLLADRLSDAAKQDFMQEITHGGIIIWDIPNEPARKIPALMKKYAKLPMDLADASLVLLAEHLGHGRILTTDQRDFGAYRWKSTKPFVNLMAQA
jgi:uncharacterized protein